MNKQELIDHVALETGLSKADSERSLNAITGKITDLLSHGEDLVLVGFGTFTTVNVSARTGRNPQTGETINIPGGRKPKFKPGKALKDAVKE